MTKPILLVEDEETDVVFMQLAMQSEGVKNHLSIARDGQEALAYLKGEGQYADRHQYPVPGLMLLDLRLPYVPGLDILKWVRSTSAFTQLPVLVLSSSNQDSDVEIAYLLGANGYLVKPPLVFELRRIVALIKRFWLDQDGPPPNCPEWEAICVRKEG